MHRRSWVGIPLGLAVHTLIDGVACREPDPVALNEGAENKLCPTGAVEVHGVRVRPFPEGEPQPPVPADATLAHGVAAPGAPADDDPLWRIAEVDFGGVCQRVSLTIG